MTLSKDPIEFPFTDAPLPGEVLEVSSGIFWVRMPLPTLIDHVNVYILEGKEDLTVVDTGLNFDVCKNAWKEILGKLFKNKPVRNIIVTHHHPDHVGLVGWFKRNYSSEVFSSRTSWLMARMLYLDKQLKPSAQAIDFWRKAGMDEENLTKRKTTKPFNYADVVSSIPLGFQNLLPKQELILGDQRWRVEYGNGHAPDHITLWGVDKPVVIAGDQIIPGISPNLGVYPTEPFLDTASLWIKTCKEYQKLALSEHLVLPGHKLPFFGLRTRLAQLIQNHEGILSRIEKALNEESCTAVELFAPVYNRIIGTTEYGLALAETLGHLNYFRSLGRLSWIERDDGALIYSLK